MSDPISPQLSLAILERVQLTFANFVAQTKQDQSVVEALLSLTSDAESAQAVTLIGARGTGKTHLLYAILNAKDLGYSSSDCQYLDCLRIKGYAELLQDFSPKQLTLLDNVDALQGDRDDEVALFSLIERVRQSGGVFVAASARGIEATQWELKDVASRLSAGLLYSLTELDDEHTRIALSLRFQGAGLTVSERVLDYMMTHFSRDKHALFEAVETLDNLALREQRKITIPFLKAHFS